MTEFPDFQLAPNISNDPATYELENAAIDHAGTLWCALEAAMPWKGRVLIDLGCGTGFFLPRYVATGASSVIGVEPDPALRPLAKARCPDLSILAGSAEHLPLPDATVDVIHARFSYFWGQGSEAGIAECKRVLRPGGALVVIDNDHDHGDFAQLLGAAGSDFASRRQPDVDAWWKAQGAERNAVVSSWQFKSRSDLEAVLTLEFPSGSAGQWLAEHPDSTSLTYGFVLFTLRR